MENVITRKGSVQEIISGYKGNTLEELIDYMHDKLLSHKVKFPVLEYSAELLTGLMDTTEIERFCLETSIRQTEGGNVLIGRLLIDYLDVDFYTAWEIAAECISNGAIWYSSDIIGERVFGNSLLKYPEMSIEQMGDYSLHPNPFVVRSLGAGTHFAMKRGISYQWAEPLFLLLMRMSLSSEKEVKQGIGWAAKSTARFHPDLIDKYQDDLAQEQIPNWFNKKIEMGLERNRYATRNKG